MTKKDGDRNKNFTLTSEKLQMFEMAVWKAKNLYLSVRVFKPAHGPIPGRNKAGK